MNVMLRTMARNGWVELVPDAAKGRARPYRITAGGEEGLAPARESVLAVEERLIGGLAETDREALLSLLVGCLRRLE